MKSNEFYAFLCGYTSSSEALLISKEFFKAFGGCVEYIPQSINTEKRNEMIQCEYSRLISVGVASVRAIDRIANAENLKRKQIYNILNKTRQKSVENTNK